MQSPLSNIVGMPGSGKNTVGIVLAKAAALALANLRGSSAWNQPAKFYSIDASNHLQRFIASGVAPLVVDLFEVVQIKH